MPMPFDATLKDLAPVIRQIGERLEHEGAPEDRAKLLVAAYVLTGLRLPKEQATDLFRGLQLMKESSTYQAILEEGREEGREEGWQRGTHEFLLRTGTKKFGSPSTMERAALIGITDGARLSRLAERLFDAASWQELLSTA